MPNGEDKNWVRTCLTLEAFYARYGHWPTRLRFPAYAFEDLRHLFRPETLARFLERFEVVVDDTMFAAESDGGRRFDYMSENAFGHYARVSAAAYFGCHPDAGGPPAENANVAARTSSAAHYDLMLAGRVLRYLTPEEVVREVIRFLVTERHLNANQINQITRAPLVDDVRPGGQEREMLADPWLMRGHTGAWVRLKRERDWADYRDILYRIDATLPFGVVQWRETAVMSKVDILGRLQLQQRRHRRRYVPPFPQARGPIPDSYPVAAFPLFAGQCPRSEEELATLWAGGVTAVVDLRVHGEEGHSSTSGSDQPVERHRYPMQPGRAPSDDEITTVIMVINDCLDRGKAVYVHDKGGLGRSTIVLACLLVEWGLTPREALDQIRTLASMMPKAAGRRIPETKEQEQRVLAWTPRVLSQAGL